MTDKLLIEQVKADRKRGFQSVWSPTLPVLQDRILADAEVIKAAEANVARMWDALDKALERLDASAFTNAEHAQAAEILRAALRDKGTD